MKEFLFKHVRDDNHNPLATLAYSKNKDRIGVAVCSKKDQFSRKRGRQIALGRAITGHSCKRQTERLVQYGGEHQPLELVLINEADKLQERAARYYKGV